MSQPPQMTLTVNGLRDYLNEHTLFFRYKGYLATGDFAQGDLAAALHDGKEGEPLKTATQNWDNGSQQFTFELVDGLLKGQIFIKPSGGKKVAVSAVAPKDGKDGYLCACKCSEGSLFSIGISPKGHVISTEISGTEYYWTVISETDNEGIKLTEWKGNHQQAWGFISNKH